MCEYVYAETEIYNCIAKKDLLWTSGNKINYELTKTKNRK